MSMLWILCYGFTSRLVDFYVILFPKIAAIIRAQKLWQFLHIKERCYEDKISETLCTKRCIYSQQ